MSYVQVKVYLTEQEIDDAIMKSAKEQLFTSGLDKELYVVDWAPSNMDKYALEANLAIKDKEPERELPSIPKVLYRG